MRFPPFSLLNIWTMTNETIKQGKKAGIVTYQVGDTMLAREYNPHPANPRTDRQVANRAKIKLLSQIAAVFRVIIAIFPSSGKSARSIFSHLNWSSIYSDGLTARFNLLDLKLTDSTISLGPIQKLVASTGFRSRVWLFLPDPPPSDVRAVFYYVFHLDECGKLVFDEYAVQEYIDQHADIGYFAKWMLNFKVDQDETPQYDYYVFAFGMVPLTSDAWDKWTSHPYEPAEWLANVIKAKYITADDFSFTETRSLSWYRGEL